MSLQVWLPLTKDLRQQGLSNVTVTNNGATFNSAGKLGGCYSVDNVKQIGCNNCISLGTTFSIAFWSKINSKNVDWGNIFKIYKDGADYIGMCLAYTTDTNPKLGFHIYRNNGSNAREAVIDGYKEYSLNNWFHTAITVTPTKAIVYKNGEIFNTFTISKSFPSITNYSLWLGKNGIGNGLDCSINDFRLYDHCLSPMEVKELAKGLVLHYPLNRQGWGQENLMRNTYRADGNNSNQVYGWMANGNGNPEIVTKDGNECIHLQASCTGAYTPSIVSASKLLLENGVDYIVSCDLMYDKEIKVQNTTPVHYHNGSTSSTDPFNLTNVNNGKGFVWKSVKPVANTIIPANTWQHYEMRLTAVATPTDSSLPYSTYRAFIYGAVRTTSETATVNMWLKNWKIEKGTIATPWCPNSSDTLAITMGLNSTTEYDCSGFCNNGSKGGSTISYTSDTPKYAVSTQLIGTTVDTSSNTKTGAAYITGPCSLSNITALTVTWWAKIRKYGRGGIMDLTSWTSNYEEGTDYNTCPLSNWDSTFRLWDGTNAFNFFSYVLKDSTWHHYAVTFTSGSGKFYRDGANIASSGTMGNTLTNFNGIRTGLGKAGGVYRQIDEDVSDLRIYATALSADDVKSLYQNSAYIDSSGNVYGAVHSEV